MFKIHSCIAIYFRNKIPYEVRWDYSFFQYEPPNSREMTQFVREKLKEAGWSVHITEPRYADSGRESDMLAEIILAEHRYLTEKENQNDKDRV